MEPVDPSVDMVVQGGAGSFEGPGYEATDVSLRGIILGGLALTAVIVLAMVVVAGWYAILANRERAELADAPPRFSDESEQYPEPILQGSPAADMVTMRAHDTEQLNTYGWTDQDRGIARIPIDRAMDLTLSTLKSSTATSPKSTVNSEPSLAPEADSEDTPGAGKDADAEPNSAPPVDPPVERGPEGSSN